MAAKKVKVLTIDDTPVEEIPGTSGIKRIITRENTGMDITFSVGRLEPGAGHGWHSHEIQDEALYILEGNGTMSIEKGDDIAYRPGMAIIIPAKVRHQNRNSGETPVKAVSIFNPALR
ncbi:cupin domain-containing protein [Thermodesulfobacteriota bacterium]